MQDPNDGFLKEVKPEDVENKLTQGWHGPFSVGELLPWKGVWFEVETIYKDGIMLKARKSKPA